MKFEKSQEQAVNLFVDWLYNKKELLPFVMDGGAGSGKTFTTMNGLLPELVKSRMPCVLTSTTHQANQMLMVNLKDAGINAEPLTIHSFLGLKPASRKQPRNPKQFVQSGYRMRNTIPSQERILLIIDEAYRIDKVLYEILTFLHPNARCIFVGDPYQTPPVGSEIPYLSTIKCVRATLTESPRFKNGGTLGKTVTALRKQVSDVRSPDQFILPPDDAFIYKSSKAQVRDLVLNLVSSETPIVETDLTIVTGTKVAEHKLNNYILAKRKEMGIPLVCPNESFSIDMVIESCYEEQSDLVSDLRKLRKFTHEMLNWEWEYANYGVQVELDTAFVILVTPWAAGNHNDDFMKLLAFSRKSGKDLVFLRLNIARTIHLAQGLTADKVLLDVASVNRWQTSNMRKRLRYTGLSRAAKEFSYY